MLENEPVISSPNHIFTILWYICQPMSTSYPYIQIGSGNNIFYVIEGHQHTTENRGGKDVVGIRGG